MQKYLIVGLILIFLGLIGIVIYYSNYSVNIPFKLIGKKMNQAPTPSPFPFQELTIPYLRSREYKSSLGELELVSSNGSFESYLTSFLSDGLKINGLLTIPKIGPETSPGRRQYPAVVFVHGYIPPTQYQTLERYQDHVDYLSRAGFVVFKIDLRGHGDSEGEAGGGYYSSDYIVDVLNAYAALQATEFVDSNKIGLWGHSMAGNVVMRSLAAKPEIPVVVIWSGAVYTYEDLAEFGISDNSYQPQPTDTERQRKRQQIRQLYGDPKDGNPFWKLVAPTNYLSEIKGAIQLNHAIDDNVVSVEYSRNLNSILDKTSIYHELNEYPTGGHNIVGTSFTEAMKNTVQFFKEKLK